MAELNGAPEPGFYSRALRRGWPMVVASLLLGLAAGAAMLSQLPQSYASTSSVLVTSTGAQETAAVGSRTIGGSVNLDTEAQLLRSADVVGRVLTKLQPRVDPATISDQVSVSVPANTTVLEVRFTADTPELARDGAEAFAAAYLASRREMAKESLEREATSIRDQLEASQEEQRLLRAGIDDDDGQVTRARLQSAAATSAALAEALVQVESSVVTPGRVINEAPLPSSAASPSTVTVLGSAGALGLLLGLGLAVRAERVHPRLLDDDDVRRELRLPVLARLPLEAEPGGVAHPRSDEGLALAQIAHRLGEFDASLVLVVPVSGTAAATHVATNLAWRRARSGSATRLVTEHGPPALDVALEESAASPGLRTGIFRGKGGTVVAAPLDVADLGGDPENLHDLADGTALTFLAAIPGSGLLHLAAHDDVPCLLVVDPGVDHALAARHQVRRVHELGGMVTGVVLASQPGRRRRRMRKHARTGSGPDDGRLPGWRDRKGRDDRPRSTGRDTPLAAAFSPRPPAARPGQAP